MPFIAKLMVACGVLLALPGTAMGAITLTGPASVPESGGTATYTLTCGGDVLDVLAGTFTVASGPAPGATAGDDYTQPPLTALPFTCLTLVPSEVTLQVPIVNDTIDEANENFTVSATSLPGVETSIIDDDPIASIAPVTLLAEGDSVANVVVALASAAAQPTTIGFSTDDFSATAGSDYKATSGQLVIPTGQMTGTISIPIIDDKTPEKPEAFYLNLTTTNNGSLNPTKKQAAIGIFDNDKAAVPIVSMPKSVSVDEGNKGTGNILFNVNLSSAATQQTTVNWKTSNWTADKADYDSAHGKVVFKPGQKARTISVDVKGDRRNEPDEAFIVELKQPAGAVLGARKASFGIIEDDDGPKMKIGKPRLSHDQLITKVGCPKSADRCKGRLVAKSHGLKLGRKRFKLHGGESKRLRLNLSDKAQDALSERRLRAKLKATARDASGDRRVTTRKARLPKL